MTLACGPYFDEAGMAMSLVIFLAVKPLAYFAFIQAFRYRVNRPVPMRFRHAAKLALARAVLGIVLVGPVALLVASSGVGELVWMSWVYLYAERVFSWWLIGAHGAKLRGRRLLGWIVSGTMINAAFDVAVIGGLFAGVGLQLAVVAGISVFIAALHIVGRRQSLLARFGDWSSCKACGYNLTGNLSGRCPECGVVIGAAATV